MAEISAQMAYMRFTIHSMPELTPVGAAAVEENRGPPLVLLCPPSELPPHSLFSSLGAKLSSGAGCCPEADASCSRFSRSMMCCLVSWKARTKPTHSTTVQVAAYMGRLRIGYSCLLYPLSLISVVLIRSSHLSGFHCIRISSFAFDWGVSFIWEQF